MSCYSIPSLCILCMCWSTYAAVGRMRFRVRLYCLPVVVVGGVGVIGRDVVLAAVCKLPTFYPRHLFRLVCPVLLFLS